MTQPAQGWTPQAAMPLVTNANVRLIALTWLFAVVMAALSAALKGDNVLELWLLNFIPPYLSSIAWTVGLIWLAGRLTRAPLILRLPVILLATVAVAVAQTLMDMAYNLALALTVAPSWLVWARDFSADRFGFVAILYVWTFAFCLLLVWAMRANDQARLNAARAAAFEAATLKAEANALRLQLNPHFLFNTLNSIAALTVTERVAEAERMINLLADFLRASIGSDPGGMVTLGEEVAVAEAYLRIEEVRFGSRMAVTIDVPAALREVAVPNFILQPLVENAVKHGMAGTRTGLEIAIAAEPADNGIRVRVTNSCRRGHTHYGRQRAAQPAREGLGLGLANTRQRIAVAYGDAAAMSADATANGFAVELLLPGIVPAASLPVSAGAIAG